MRKDLLKRTPMAFNIHISLGFNIFEENWLKIGEILKCEKFGGRERLLKRTPRAFDTFKVCLGREYLERETEKMKQANRDRERKKI